MSGTTRAILHETMEQQTGAIAKVGIIVTLNTRTSILASTNPVESRYNPSFGVIEIIQLPPRLLSRFDLIYIIIDTPNMTQDRILAQHFVGLYYGTPNVVQPPLDHSLLRDYIAYARKNIHPELSDIASGELIEAYGNALWRCRRLKTNNHCHATSAQVADLSLQVAGLDEVLPRCDKGECVGGRVLMKDEGCDASDRHRSTNGKDRY